ncbi:MAG: aminotransferase class I/II-fold pyridoxal phosphate-dependent enzyme [Candidatus Methylopumilus sp.]|nr:aminotransferase class I/II-fold pyridoxal phosphate-dependent enzyme [Candidatus Methylopumilus sp.]
MQIQSKLPEVGATIFTTMSKMALEYQAINLGQGFPDFNTEPALLRLVSEAMDKGFNQYPAMAGVMPLREVINHKIAALYQHQYDPDTEITITSGATQAIMASVLACVGTGDEVIVLEPCYDCYIPAIKLAGGTAISVPMRAPGQTNPVYSVDWTLVHAAITKKTKLVIVNFPHNPTGAVITPGDLDELERLVQQHHIFLLSDEVYEHIIFDGVQHISLCTRPALAARSFVISSFGKTTHTTGWKIGYCCAPKHMTAELRKVHQFMVFTVPSPFQHALAAYTADASTYLSLPGFYQTKRDYLSNGLRQTRFKVLPSPGTFFLLADYSDISDQSEADFAVWLTQTHGVTVIPVSAFYQSTDAPASNHQLVRFCFAKQEATLDLAIERLAKV